MVISTNPPATVRRLGPEPQPPGQMSLTIIVPPAVPSDFQSSAPEAPLSATKSVVLPNVTSSDGAEAPEGLMSLTRKGADAIAGVAARRASPTKNGRIRGSEGVVELRRWFMFSAAFF